MQIISSESIKYIKPIIPLLIENNTRKLHTFTKIICYYYTQISSLLLSFRVLIYYYKIKSTLKWTQLFHD